MHKSHAGLKVWQLPWRVSPSPPTSFPASRSRGVKMVISLSCCKKYECEFRKKKAISLTRERGCSIQTAMRSAIEDGEHWVTLPNMASAEPTAQKNDGYGGVSLGRALSGRTGQRPGAKRQPRRARTHQFELSRCSFSYRGIQFCPHIPEDFVTCGQMTNIFGERMKYLKHTESVTHCTELGGSSLIF